MALSEKLVRAGANGSGWDAGEIGMWNLIQRKSRGFVTSTEGRSAIGGG